MTDSSFLPASAPFAAAERTTLERVLVAATPVQRAWLAGFLAGVDARSTGEVVGTAPALAAPPQLPLTVLFASESGNAETLAHRFAKLARGRGFKPTVLDFADLDITRLPQLNTLLVVAATWGEGEPPSRAVHGVAALIGEGAPRLAGLRFSVLSLGDTSYAELCLLGRQIDARLEALGAARVLDRIDCDLDFEEPASAWIETALQCLAPVAASPAAPLAAALSPDDTAPRDCTVEVIDHVNLNSSRSDKETIHLALAFNDAALPYEPGDALDIFVENDPALVEDVLAQAGLAGDDALRRTLRTERDITTLSPVTAERFVAATGHSAVRQLIESGENPRTGRRDGR